MRARVALIAAAAAALLAGCTPPAQIDGVNVSEDQMQLDVILNTCNGDVEVMVEETDSTVTISVVDHRPPIQTSGQDCQDLFSLPLESPLGDRQIIEASSGNEIAWATVPPIATESAD